MWRNCSCFHSVFYNLAVFKDGRLGDIYCHGLLRKFYPWAQVSTKGNVTKAMLLLIHHHVLMYRCGWWLQPPPERFWKLDQKSVVVFQKHTARLRRDWWDFVSWIHSVCIQGPSFTDVLVLMIGNIQWLLAWTVPWGAMQGNALSSSPIPRLCPWPWPQSPRSTPCCSCMTFMQLILVEKFGCFMKTSSSEMFITIGLVQSFSWMWWWVLATQQKRQIWYSLVLEKQELLAIWRQRLSEKKGHVSTDFMGFGTGLPS